MKEQVNPIVEELWQTWDELAREAGDDVARICENTRSRDADNLGKELPRISGPPKPMM